MRDPARWEFHRHMPVYLASGRRLGFLLEVDHGVECVHVQEGRVLVRDWYVPVGAIASVTDRGIFLTLDAGDLRRQRMNVPPEIFLLHQGSTPGYEYTSPADLPSYRSE
jgi:hypothetical protein